MKGSIIPRGPDTFQLRWSVKGPDGKRKQFSTTFHGGKRAADTELRRILQELDSGRTAATKQTTGAYFADFLRHLEARGPARNTLLNARRALLTAAAPLAGTRLAALRAHHLQDLVTGWLERGLAAGTVTAQFAWIRRALRRAVALELIGRNPTEGVELPRAAARPPPEVSVSETIRLLQLAEGDRLYAPILIACACGLRAGEVCALRWSDVDLERCTVTVRQQAVGRAVGPPKTGASAAPVPLLAFAVPALRAHRAAQSAQRLRLGRYWQDNDLIVSGPDGSAITPAALSVAFGRFVRKRGIALRFHDLRHGFASQAHNAGANQATIARLLRHSGVGAAGIYIHPTPGEERAAAERLDRAFRSQSRSHPCSEQSETRRA